eukprot:724929-Amorphochlora_amoeboformis.AAC.1
MSRYVTELIKMKPSRIGNLGLDLENACLRYCRSLHLLSSPLFPPSPPRISFLPGISNNDIRIRKSWRITKLKSSIRRWAMNP